jgi:hypothetical protein
LLSLLHQRKTSAEEPRIGVRLTFRIGVKGSFAAAAVRDALCKPRRERHSPWLIRAVRRSVTDTSRDSAATYASSTMQAHWHALQRVALLLFVLNRDETRFRRAASVRSQTRQQVQFHAALNGKDA